MIVQALEKGRLDLMPLDIVAMLLSSQKAQSDVLWHIHGFTETGDTSYLIGALRCFCELRGWDMPTMILETAIHMAYGAEKYSPNNWKKGIPAERYVDSSTRHFLRWLRGDNDEAHDRAVCWNLICCAWTCKHKPELNDFKK